VQDFCINYADDVGVFGFDVLDIDDGDDIFNDEDDDDEQEVIRILGIG
jgi:hypothetical protein